LDVREQLGKKSLTAEESLSVADAYFKAHPDAGLVGVMVDSGVMTNPDDLERLRKLNPKMVEDYEKKEKGK
jgi:hypothetical protein